MAAGKHLAGFAGAVSFTVECGDGLNRNPSAHWPDPGRARHWADQAAAAGCCTTGHHEVVPAAPERSPR